MAGWKNGDRILMDDWKPEMKPGSRQTYRKKILSFLENANVKEITGFADIKTAVLNYLGNSAPDMHAANFNLQEHVEKIQVVVQYFGWLIKCEKAYPKLKKDLSLPSKYTPAALKKLSEVYLPKYKHEHPEYILNQKDQQQRESIKQKKRKWAAINQQRDQALTELSEKKRKQSGGCAFDQSQLVPHLSEINLPNEILICNCQKSNFPSCGIDFIRLLDWHHIRDKENFPDLKYDERNGRVLCKGHHLWITVLTQPKHVALIKSSIKNHFIQKIKIFSDADAGLLDKLLEGIVDSVDVWYTNQTAKNLQQTHKAVFRFNTLIYQRCRRHDPHRAD